MQIINYISLIAMPLVIFCIILFGIINKKKVFDLFIEGVEDGIKITIKLLPTLIALFFAIGTLKSSGVIEGIEKIISPIFIKFKFPTEILPLAILRPISRKCVNCYGNRHNEKIWSRYRNWINSISNNGSDGNNIIYNYSVY